MTKALERFKSDTANHTMEVLHDDGLYRHLKFSNGGSQVYRFDLITWPGYLCISGDMGCYTFSRVRDMFEFFRDDRGSMGINPGYWQEKIQAGPSIAPRDIAKEWSPEQFREQILTHFEDHTEDLDGEARDELWEAIKDEVLVHDDNEDCAMRAAMDFRHGNGPDLFEFEDFFEHDCTEWSFHYLWCCYAIVWGISQYDQQQEVAA